MDEISPLGDSAANGIAERAILTVEGLVKTTNAVVKKNVLGGPNAFSCFTAWMVHHAAQVIHACMVGTDGLASFRRLKEGKFGRLLGLVSLCGSGNHCWRG